MSMLSSWRHTPWRLRHRRLAAKVAAAGAGILVVSLVSAPQPQTTVARTPALALSSVTDDCSIGSTAPVGGVVPVDPTAHTASAKTNAANNTPPAYQQVVQPSDARPRTIAYDGAKLVIKPGAVRLPTGIGITPLGASRVPKMDSTMTNVTARPQAGYRFTPHPMKFAETITVTIPYDPALLTDGFTAQDIYTHWWDDTETCWKPLERVSVDEVNHTVTSTTDHFTDMVNATVMTPDSPEGASFDPNQIKGIQAANPGSMVNMITPPGADNQGDNRLAYPLEIPAGRAGVQPRLSVTYDSSGGNGWMGVGWDLPVQAVMVDVRWGVPRYSTQDETETYTMNSEQLTPVAHRGPLQPRSSEKVFHMRTEGSFARIVRHGDNPTNYSWEVTDKLGTHWFYGGDANGATADATLTDDWNHVFMWALREVRDARGNTMRYRYTTVSDPGVNGGTEPGRNLYIQKITYTGENGQEGRYALSFYRDRDLGESLRVDRMIDARGGFKRVTADLLRRVDVTLDDTLVRRYGFDYTTGAFFKSLLASITQYDSDGLPFNTHRFDYFDDIRDGQGAYQAFERTDWTSPDDGLSKGALNLTPNHAGDASAVNANTSTSAGGHLYVGAGIGPQKSGSVGVKTGFSRGQTNGLLALIDVDGDNLPDKVFRDGGTVKYRRNLSGPNGQPRFEDQLRTLNLPGINGESSNSLTLGVEGYLGGVAAQLDYVNTFATNSQYFIDVNGDGITDLVNGSNVLFGRVGDNGTPVYGVSGDTPVPVGSGQMDTSGLFGSFDADRQRLNDSFPLLDSVRRWVAPFAGTVKIEGAVRLSPDTADARAASNTADGVRATIQSENTELWAEQIGAHDDTSHTPTGVDSVSVTRGQRLYFRVQSGADGGLDEVSWDPKVSYLNVTDTTDVNGLSPYTYQASRDFTLAGRHAELTVPLTGTMHLSGDLHKTAATTDDVSVVITRDGTPVFQQTLTAAVTGTISVDADVAVTQGQKLAWRIKVDSPIDVDTLDWAPHAVYTAADGVDRLTGADGKPLIAVDPPYDLDIYPDDRLTAAQGSYHVAADGQLTVNPFLFFNFDSSQPTATIAFTVKRRGGLLAKKFVQINNGVVSQPGSFTVDAQAGDELFFDFSTLDDQSDPTRVIRIRDLVTSMSVTVTPAGGSIAVAPSAFHGTLPEGAFPQPYRGWAAVGYNGNARATLPIVQADLVIDDSFRNQLPSGVDPQAQKDAFAADPRITPPKVTPFRPAPQNNRWEGGERSWVTPDRVSSSRMGVDSVRLPRSSDFAGRVAPPRVSRSDQISVTGSVGGGVGSAGGSVATGDSTGQVDFIDMNGDQFPDVVSSGGIQYTNPDGALGATRGAIPDGAVRRSGNVTGNASAGSAARTIQTGRSYAAPPAHTTANNASSGNDMPPFSVGGNLGGSKSDSAFDLLDLNADGLPDRIYDDGRVALNLGYRFGQPEPWRNPAALNAGTGSNFGLNLGFNTDFYGFAGGVSYSEGDTTTHKTLMDVNGDALIDRIFDTNPISVALNTGNGFEPPVPFNGSLPGINGDKNSTLGGGAYFRFSLCFTVVCVVINPGGNFSTGASRTEQVLRDINGDGYIDQLSSTRDSELVVAQNRTGRTNMLKSVSRPLGARMDFDYTRDGNNYGQPQSRWVLTKVSVNDGRPGDGQDVRLVTYEYSGGNYDRLEREFDGYATVRERVRDHGANDAVFRTITREYRTDGHYTRGLVTRELTSDSAGRPFLETLNTYTLRDVADPPATADPHSTTATVFPAMTRIERRFYEGQDTASKSTFMTMDYDEFGNATHTFDGADNGPGDDLDTQMTYSADTPACRANYIVGVAISVNVVGAGTVMRHRESTVDCTTSDVTQVRAALASGEQAVTDMAYFPNGNLKTVTGPPNQSGQRYKLDYTYDSTVDIYMESTVDSFGYRSTSTHNFLWGLVESTTDENGQVIRNTYDKVGRLDTVTGPYELPEDRITIDFEYHPEAPVPYAITRHVDRQADGSVIPDTIDTITFVDGLKRPVQTKMDATISTGPSTPPVDVMLVSGQTTLDFLGRGLEQYYPTTEPKGTGNTTFTPGHDTVAPTRATFDVLDRTTQTTIPDGSTSVMAYGFGPDRAGTTQFQTTVTDPKGNTKITYSDVRELVVAIRESNPAGGHPTVWTSYAYDPMSQLTAVVDDQGNTTTETYDNFGRSTETNSPDAGRTRSVYDLAGNQTQQITAKLDATGQAINYDYDFNRLSGIRYPIFTANNVSYTYGAPGAPNNGADRVVAMTDGAGSITREYGPLGEVTKETRTTPVQGNQTVSYTTSYRFDSWNRMLSMTYPDGEVLSYHYNSGGMVDRATGAKAGTTYPYLTRMDYDKFEEQVLMETGNGTRTQFTFDPADRRMTNLKANIAQGYVFENLNYTYDEVGNVTSVTNDTQVPPGPEVGAQVGGPATQTFQYDDVYQLTHSEGSYESRTGKVNTYSVDLSYDSIHNITTKNQSNQEVSNGNVSDIGKTSYDYSYVYASGRPHAASVTGPYTFAYDENGNQISRDQQPKPRRQMVWDEENRLACSHENVQSQTLPQTPASCDNAGGTPNAARYRYDDQGMRVVKDGAQFHVYPNRNFSTNGNKQFKHVFIGDMRLLTKFVEKPQQVEDRQFYAHSDHLGSTGFVTDASGGLAEHLKYFPGGETWISEHPVQPVPQQFTGKELDNETNLYYYGARYYDPRTQAWQTPDPALDDYMNGTPNGGVYHSPNLALYTYGYNNPVRLNDPDGLFDWDRVAGAAKLVGGIAEAAAGVALGAATSWTGVGAVGGALVAAHGLDVAISGARQLISGKETSSFTSQGLQKAGVSKNKAELIDAGISVVGSLGAGLATKVAARGATALAARSAAAAGNTAKAARAARAASAGGGTTKKLVQVYRGTSITTELGIIEETGKSMSDAARVAYMESGGSMKAALAASEEAHAAGIAQWGSEGLYAEAHARLGQDLSKYGPRSFISWTTDPARAKYFATENGRVFTAWIEEGQGVWQTLPGATESEILIRHMIDVIPW